MATTDPKAQHRIGYGLYAVSAREGDRDNAMIANAVMQVTNTPERVAIALNKESFTHDMILRTGKMNVNCLSVDTPYSVFEHFGMQSGKTVSKFEGMTPARTASGLAIVTEHANAYFELLVESTADLGTHTMFVCSITESRVLSDAPTMTYADYHARVKPKPEANEGKKGWVCKICGYVYEGDPLPEDFVCPICRHGAADFEPLN